jgi:GNAT superfamily N-acetyltransferase
VARSSRSWRDRSARRRASSSAAPGARRRLGSRTTLPPADRPTIRAPWLDELPELQAIERAAGALFLDVGLESVAADEPATLDELSVYVADGRAWVICVDDVPAGYALVDVLDTSAHLEQLSVRPEHGRHGLGTALLQHVCRWAQDQGFGAVTLTTFTSVPWNAPFYERNGFRILSEDGLTPELRALRAREAEHGLDPALRVCMRLDLRGREVEGDPTG